MINLLFFIIGFLLGYYQRELWELGRYVKSKFETKPETGITPGLYQKPNENNVNQDGGTGLVSPKTPQQLEWEEQERLRTQQLRGR